MATVYFAVPPHPPNPPTFTLWRRLTTLNKKWLCFSSQRPFLHGWRAGAQTRTVRGLGGPMTFELATLRNTRWDAHTASTRGFLRQHESFSRPHGRTTPSRERLRLRSIQSVKPLMADIVLVAALRSGVTFSIDGHIFLPYCVSTIMGILNYKAIYLFVLSKLRVLTENTVVFSFDFIFICSSGNSIEYRASLLSPELFPFIKVWILYLFYLHVSSTV